MYKSINLKRCTTWRVFKTLSITTAWTVLHGSIQKQQKGCKEAQFQLGYKGYIQLAIRSGQYKKLNVLAIKDGELVRFDPLNEEIEVNLIDDEEVREEAKTIGYYAMFEYTNGFRKAMYWSKKKMEAHALKYSKGYAAKKDIHSGRKILMEWLIRQCFAS